MVKTVLGQLPPRKVAPTPKLTLTQTVTLTRGQFSSGGIIWLSSNPKTNHNLDPNSNPNRGGAIVRTPVKTLLKRHLI